MRSFHWGEPRRLEAKVLRLSFPLAIFLEITVLAVLGALQKGQGWIQSSSSPSQASWVEAQIYEMPEKAHLVEQQKAPTPATRSEISIHPKANQTQTAARSSVDFDQANQTEQGSVIPRDHGPIPIFRPNPVLPAYLEYQEADQSVVVIFEVLADGSVNPRLVVSSGHPEIDAVILETLKKWKFQPEVRDGKPVNSRFRTRVEVIPS